MRANVTSLRVALVALAALGCHASDRGAPGDATPFPQAEDVTPPSPTLDCDPSDRFPDLALGAITTGCDPQGYAFDVLFEATAWTGTGRLLVVDPSAPDSPELHVIETWTWDPCGLWDELRASIRAGDAWSMGASTAFACDGLDAAPPLYTFAAWVTRYLDDDAVADCVVWGPGADDVRAGVHDRWLADLEGLPNGTLAGCRDR